MMHATRQGTFRRCLACGSPLNAYAAPERTLCGLCMSLEREAFLACAARLDAARRLAEERPTGSYRRSAIRRLPAIKADALHEALWRLAAAPLAGDFRVVRNSLVLRPGPHVLWEPVTGVPRRFVASRERVEGVWAGDRETLGRHAFRALALRGCLVPAGHAAWGETSTPWEAWSLYPRRYVPLPKTPPAPQGGPRQHDPSRSHPH